MVNTSAGRKSQIVQEIKCGKRGVLSGMFALHDEVCFGGKGNVLKASRKPLRGRYARRVTSVMHWCMMSLAITRCYLLLHAVTCCHMRLYAGYMRVTCGLHAVTCGYMRVGRSCERWPSGSRRERRSSGGSTATASTSLARCS